MIRGLIKYAALWAIICGWIAVIAAIELSIVHGVRIVIPRGDLTQVKIYSPRGNALNVEIPLTYPATPLAVVVAIFTRDWIRMNRKQNGRGFPINIGDN